MTELKRVRWECRDCSLGEKSPCVYEGLLEYENEPPVQCPGDEHGASSAKWSRTPTATTEGETVPREWWDTLRTQMETDYREGARPRHAMRVSLLMEEYENGLLATPTGESDTEETNAHD